MNMILIIFSIIMLAIAIYNFLEFVSSSRRIYLPDSVKFYGINAVGATILAILSMILFFSR